ncbi:MAG: potassium-transporting ATPase subunit KdpC [Alphaproteobacteria bacterium]|nr:potassium-transporting ATPase subunit KdpC [Alphaproteobacteria bacterium]
MSHLRPALVLVAAFTLLLGVMFPLGMVGLGSAAFPTQAGGSLVMRDGRVVGSALVGQSFTGEKYFHPRPSATTPDPYNADASGGSNLAATSKALVDRVQRDMAKAGPAPVPADVVTTSASGLDPHISPDNAERQVARVAAARGLSKAEVEGLVAAHTEGRLFGLIGEPRINVLLLNLALDAQPAR